MTGKILILSLAVLLAAGAIFYFSSQDGPSSDQTSGGFVRVALRLFVPDYDELPPARQAQVRKNVNFAVRKAAHVFEYAVLGALLTLLLLEISKRRSQITGLRYSPAVPLSAGVIIGLIYAATDEAHQIFTGRSSKLSDVLIDLAGVMAGAAAAWLLSRACSSLRNDKKVKKKQ